MKYKPQGDPRLRFNARYRLYKTPDGVFKDGTKFIRPRKDFVRQASQNDSNFNLGTRQEIKLEFIVMDFFARHIQSGTLLDALAKEGWTAERYAKLLGQELTRAEAGELTQAQKNEVFSQMKALMGQAEGKKIEIKADDLSPDELDEQLKKLLATEGVK